MISRLEKNFLYNTEVAIEGHYDRRMNSNYLIAITLELSLLGYMKGLEMNK
jgi:hypothetical protein